MLLRLLDRWRAHRKKVATDASDLITFMGEAAYREARNRAREHRARHDTAGDRHWSRVAVGIEQRTGKVVGQKAADRYEADRKAEVVAPGFDRRRREVADRLTGIAQGIGDLAHGREGVTAQSVSAIVWQVVEGQPEAVQAAAGRDLRAAIEAIDPRRCAVEIEAGRYPAEIEAAGVALQRLRGFVLGLPG